MKLRSPFIIRSFILCSLSFTQTLIAQDGMDYDGAPQERFSRLQRSDQGTGPINLTFQNNNNEKAMGVYQASINPSSLLEVNSTNQYTPFFHPLISSRGEVFRTVSPFNLNAHWRLFTETGGTNLQRFRVTAIANTSDVRLVNDQNGTLSMWTNNTERMTILGDVTNNYIRDGFIGVNNNNPEFHIDIRTPEPDGNVNYGELMLRAQTVDDPNAYIAFVNLATTGTTHLPCLMGRQSNGPGTALFTLGSINNAQDLATNLAPVTVFMSGRNYDPTQNQLVINDLSRIANRPVFGWNNGPHRLMIMRANGFLGVATDNPGNRVEINSDFFDPTTGNLVTPPVTDQTDNGIAGLNNNNATGFSGLRFSDLTSNSNPQQTNPGPGVLALDSNGDVIYVRKPISIGGGGQVTADNGLIIDPANANNVQLGQTPTGGTPNGGELIRDSEIPMEGYNISFTGLGVQQSNLFSIGQPASVTFINRSRFHVYNDHENVAIDGHTFGNNLQPGTIQAGVAGYITKHTTEFGYGVWGRAVDAAGGPGYGVMGEASGNVQNNGLGAIVTDPNGLNNRGALIRVADAIFGTYGIESYASTVGNAAFGIRADAQSGITSNESYGGHFRGTTLNGTSGLAYGIKASASGGNKNYAVYAEVSQVSNQNPPNGPDYAGYFDGDVYISGTFGPSDVNMKTNIVSLDSCLEVINLLSPKAFIFDNSNFSGMHLPSGQQYGLIAQDVEQILPSIVSDNIHPAKFDSLGTVISPEYSFKGLDYQKLIPFLVGAVKEQQSQLDSISTLVNDKDSVIAALDARLTALENCLNNTGICNGNNALATNGNGSNYDANSNVTNVELNDAVSIVLEQNVPNPFAEQTTIRYVLPEEAVRAQMLFYNVEGKLINSLELNDRGEGQVNVFASDLSTGIYSYTLVVDGQVIDTKRMVKR